MRLFAAFAAASVTALSLLVALPSGCTSKVTVTAAPDTTAEDAGAPTSPEDVPAVALEADPEVDCPAGFQDAAPESGLHKGYAAAGQNRAFHLILPADTSGPRPLFVAFNGTGEDGPSFAKRAKLDDFAARGFIVLAPSSNGNGSTWPIWDSLRQPGKENDPNKDLDYFDSVVKCVAAHHPVDKNRIYVGGHSAGGIMTNHVLQRRSDFVAGGIVGSGVFSLTSPDPPTPLDPTFVIVTWGGDNDQYSGTAGGVTVGGFNFVSEASLASKFYDAQPNVGEVNCRGNDIGHAWLSGLNGWFVDRLLEHPKGLPGKGAPDLAPPVPAGARAVCNDEPYEAPEHAVVVCGPSARSGCQETCQLFGDCGVANGTVGPALSNELTAIGFSGPNNADCGGCVAKCEAEATTASDAAALACMKEQQELASCGQGIDGAYPLILAVNACCKGRTDSNYCVSICTEIMKNSSAAGFFSSCNDLVK
jgi:poly(3-hydroxybutyrate) depolymerase